MTDAFDDLQDLIEVTDASAVSPVILHAPHAGLTIPASCLSAFSISTDELAEEQRLLTDHATDRTARLVGGTSLITSGLSRLVVDVERFEGDAEEMNAVGMGVLYTHGSRRQPIRTINASERERLLAWFRTYGERFADLVDRSLAQHGRAVVMDVHSYPAEPLPYELHQADRRPQLCIGVDERHTPPGLVDAVRAAFDGWDVEVDQPFRGSYVPLRHLGDARVSSVMLEIRRDTYLDDTGDAVDVAIQDIATRIQAVTEAV